MIPGELLLYASTYFSLFTAIFFFITFFEERENVGNPKARRLPKVSVIVPAYNEERTIAKTLHSLLKLDYPKLEIIVVDDGSTDATSHIANTFPGVRVYRKRNAGKGAALNYGLAHTNGAFVACLDADSIVDPSCLKKMMGYFADPRVMAVTPSLKIFKPMGVLQRIQAVEYLLGIYLRKVFSYLGSIQVTPGPFSIFRRSFFDNYGGYDTNNLTEDIEIALRIQSHKYIIENSIDANVWTIGPKSFGTLLQQRLRWYLGFLDNVQRYRRMFSPKYGNFGLFFLPGAFISIGLIIALLFYMVIKAITSTYGRVLDLIAIHFDIFPLLNFKFKPFFFDLGPLFVFSILSLIIGIGMVLIARRYSKDREPLKFSFLLHLFLYFPLYAFWWFLALVYKATGRRVSWGKA